MSFRPTNPLRPILAPATRHAVSTPLQCDGCDDGDEVIPRKHSFLPHCSESSHSDHGCKFISIARSGSWRCLIFPSRSERARMRQSRNFRNGIIELTSLKLSKSLLSEAPWAREPMSAALKESPAPRESTSPSGGGNGGHANDSPVSESYPAAPLSPHGTTSFAPGLSLGLNTLRASFISFAPLLLWCKSNLHIQDWSSFKVAWLLLQCSIWRLKEREFTQPRSQTFLVVLAF